MLDAGISINEESTTRERDVTDSEHLRAVPTKHDGWAPMDGEMNGASSCLPAKAPQQLDTVLAGGGGGAQSLFVTH